MTLWIIAVGVTMLIGNVYLSYKVAEERQRALREFLERGSHPSLREGITTDWEYLDD